MSRRKGTALLTVVVLVVAIAGLGAALMMLTVSASRGAGHEREGTQAGYVAEAGVARIVTDLRSGSIAGTTTVPDTVFAAGTYNAAVTFWEADGLDNNGDGFVDEPAENGVIAIAARGTVGAVSRGVEVVVRETPPATGPFDAAIFAGNSSGDSTYALDFGGAGAQADDINGNVYSGQDVTMAGDSSVDGDVLTAGTLSDNGNITGEKKTGAQPIPDIAAMDYPNNHDLNVEDEFGLFSTYQYDNAGGTADQMPASHPLRFLRRNPTDRTSLTSSTPGNDYFIEDPWMPVTADYAQDGSNPYKFIVHPSANQKVIYIEGDLWLNNKKTYSLQAVNQSLGSVKMTFVVKGNIHFGDNLFYKDPAGDGIAFIAVKDPAVPDSGNIVLGDPLFGTLKDLSSFLYAENDFIDSNLNAAGSQQFRIKGTMSAGDHVRINRDAGGTHSKMTVDWDRRVSDGTLNLPGLPTSGAAPGGAPSYDIVSWRHVP